MAHIPQEQIQQYVAGSLHFQISPQLRNPCSPKFVRTSGAIPRGNLWVANAEKALRTLRESADTSQLSHNVKLGGHLLVLVVVESLTPPCSNEIHHTGIVALPHRAHAWMEAVSMV